MGRGGNGPIARKVAQQPALDGKDADLGPAVFTMEEVAKHNTVGDAWLVVRDSVYDVSDWTGHPGGSVLFMVAGTDATDTFGAFHSPEASKLLPQFRIGAFKREPSPSDEYLREYRELRNKLRKLGLFKANPLYYAYKMAEGLSILALSVYLAVHFEGFWMQTLSAALLALFWQQQGWHSHDYLHNQIFSNRFVTKCAGYLLGNAFQGFSVAWWAGGVGGVPGAAAEGGPQGVVSGKHVIHHSVPNMHGADPDIDTSPLLAWSRSIAAQHKDSTIGRLLIKVQPYTYFPILTIARLSWAYQSFYWPFTTPGLPMIQRVLEVTGLAIHYGSLGYLCYNYMTLGGAIWYVLFAECFCGILLAIVFGLGHNGMEVFEDHAEDFVRSQLHTTRNIKPSPFVSFFCGGLEFQIEHHLFPLMPRHSLKKAQPHVEAFCRKHNLPYHATSFVDGTIEVLACLMDVSKTV